MDEEQRRWLLTYCPHTHDEVVGSIGQWYSLFGKIALWWQCPACQGWHIMMKDSNNQNGVMSPKSCLERFAKRSKCV